MPVRDLVAVAKGASVSLERSAVDQLEAAREVVHRVAESGVPVYGLNTGLGHSRNDDLPRDALKALQPSLIAMHAGTIGAKLPTEAVRAAMMAQLTGFTRGGSGVTVAAACVLRDMLNAGVHPVVSESGSVGASDLGHMASIAMVALGAGQAELRGEYMDGAAALAAAGLRPLEPQPNEGLALVSSNGMTVGNGAIVVDRAQRLLDAADVVAAMSLEALGGNASIVEAEVAAAKGSCGQELSANRMRQVLAGSALTYGETVGVQDALSFRVAPQVHGAVRDLIAFASNALYSELNSRSSNPLVSVKEGRMISNGNFHPLLVALSMDGVRPGLAHIGQISDRRVGHLWDGFLADALRLDRQTLVHPPPRMAGFLSRYAAAARSTRLRHLAGPVSLDVPSLELGIEDHATNAFETVLRTADALDILEDLLTVELLVAHKRLTDPSATSRPGKGTGLVIGLMNKSLAGLSGTARVPQVLEHVRSSLLYSISEAVDSV